MNDSSTVWVVLGAIGVSAAVLLGFLFLRNGGSAAQAPVAVPPINEADHVRGNRESAIVLVEYFDFQCPACAAYAPIIATLVDEYGDRVAFVSRYFPLPQHQNGMNAALAVEAAARQGKYGEMHDLMFANQEIWAQLAGDATELFEGYAEQIGLDVAQYRVDRSAPEVRARVEKDFADGQRIGVNSTPSFYLNGVELNNPRSIENFRALLDEALAAQAAAPMPAIE